MDTHYKVHITPERAFVKVLNKASYLNCDPLRKFFDDQTKNGQKNFVLDFHSCTSVDSTFLGILVGVALQIRQGKDQGSLVLLNLRGRNLETVCNLGIHQIANVCQDELSCDRELDDISMGTRGDAANAETIYNAHKTLMNLNKKNMKVFSDVVSYLEQKKEP